MLKLQQKEDIIKAIGSITNIGIDNAILTVTNKYTLNDAVSYIRDGGTVNIFGTAEKSNQISIDFE
ncbi:unnamed protein product, partial [marine sediment metagenome]